MPHPASEVGLRTFQAEVAQLVPLLCTKAITGSYGCPAGTRDDASEGKDHLETDARYDLCLTSIIDLGSYFER